MMSASDLGGAGDDAQIEPLGSCVQPPSGIRHHTESARTKGLFAFSGQSGDPADATA